MKKNKIPIRSIILGIIVLSTCIYFINISYTGLSRDYVEDGWEAAPATVLNPDLELQGKKNIDRKVRGIEQTINYEYTIDGKTYQSNSVSKELFVNQDDFPEGKAITVYYNPSDITEVVLIRTKVQKQYLYGMIVFCIGVIGITFFCLIKDFRGK